MKQQIAVGVGYGLGLVVGHLLNWPGIVTAFVTFFLLILLFGEEI